MKKYLLFIIAIICIVITACTNNTNDLTYSTMASSESIISLTSTQLQSAQPTAPTTEDISTPVVTLPIEYNADKNADRAMMTLDFLNNLLSKCEQAEKSYAICLVTVKEIGLDDLQDSKGTCIPVAVKIDRILSATSAFSNRAGDELTVSDYSSWFKMDGYYEVGYSDGRIPLTTIGAQYVVLLSQPDSDSTLIDFEIDLKAIGLSVPIVDGSTDLDYLAEQYLLMELPPDAQLRNADLFALLFGEQNVPSAEEIESRLEQMREEIQ